MPKNEFKFSIMFGENVEIQRFESASKLYIMVGMEKNLKTIYLNCLKMHSNCPPWLEKKLKFIYLKCLRMLLNCLPRVPKNGHRL